MDQDDERKVREVVGGLRQLAKNLYDKSYRHRYGPVPDKEMSGLLWELSDLCRQEANRIKNSLSAH